jgi:hypothetical protein
LSGTAWAPSARSDRDSRATIATANAGDAASRAIEVAVAKGGRLRMTGSRPSVRMYVGR